MRRIRFSFLRPLSCVLATFAAVASNSVAHAACNSGVFGYTNTCFGTNVLLSNEIGAYNTGFGYEVLYSNINGYNNTAIGFAALRANTSGGGNTASGWVALNANTTGIYNTASGSLALAYSTTGSYNTASGMAALHKNTTGSYNTATGSYVLYSNTTGSGNTATGDNALFSSTSGQQNTANGGGALKNATTGYRNVALGYQAGLAVTTGSDNIIIGAGNSGLAANGVIRIGTSAYQKRAFIAGIRSVTTGVADAVPVLIDSKGQLGTIKSSRRFKDDIQPMGSVSERLFSLRPVTFRYKQAYEDGSKPVQYGLVAEEVAEVLPELVVYGKDGKPETVAYHVLATLLLNELQKEHRVVEALRQDNEAQLARMAALERQNAELAALKAQVAILAQAVERADKSRMVASTR